MGIAAGRRQTSRTRVPDVSTFTNNQTTAEAAFVLRHRWGSIRINGIYIAE